MYFSRNNEDVSILRSKVTPSQRVRRDPHDVWVACTCIAGTSATCNYMNLRRDKASKAQADSEGPINEAWLNFDPRKEGQRDISEQR